MNTLFLVMFFSNNSYIYRIYNSIIYVWVYVYYIYSIFSFSFSLYKFILCKLVCFCKEGVNFLHSSWYGAWTIHFGFLTKTASIMQSYAQLFKEPLSYKKYICRYCVCFPQKSLNIMELCFSGNGWTLYFWCKEIIKSFISLCLCAHILLYLLSYLYLNPWIFLLLLFQFSPPSHGVSEQMAACGLDSCQC